MNDLEDRLIRLRLGGDQRITPASDLRARATTRAQRRRSRRIVSAGIGIVVVAVVTAFVLTTESQSPERAVSSRRSEPAPRATSPSAPPSTSAQVDAQLEPSTQLENGQEVSLVASGLRPNVSYRLVACEAGDDTGLYLCDRFGSHVVGTDSDGVLEDRWRVRTSIYGERGVTNCVVTSCVVAVQEILTDSLGRTINYAPVAEAPLTFAATAKVPVARLQIEPPGPYTAGQVVKVYGTGFPPGADIKGQLAQCPANVDPAIDERCGYPNPFTPLVVDENGNFSTDFPIAGEFGFVRCSEAPGCVLAWVLPRGPMAASIALDIR